MMPRSQHRFQIKLQIIFYRCIAPQVTRFTSRREIFTPAYMLAYMLAFMSALIRCFHSTSYMVALWFLHSPASHL